MTHNSTVGSYSYTSRDYERFVSLTPKKLGLYTAAVEQRQDFERDRARVLHSAALRRLQDKTQVVRPMQGDTPRTRLTHSLEVGQIARSIALALGANPDLADLAGLCHDIGHPPYGHNGERALDEFAADCGGFEGNAQTLRILSRLEPKVIDSGGRSRGLNLCRASLDAACKYPWGPYDKDGRKRKKYSAYEEDLDTLTWIREDVPASEPDRKSLEAEIMDWSDDVAYSVHDVEDGILSGRITLKVLWDLVELAALAERGARAFGGDPQDLLEAADRLRQMELVAYASEFKGRLSDIVALKALSSELVSRFLTSAIAETRAAYGERPLGRYEGHLLVKPEVEAEVTLLKSVAVLYVMEGKEHVAEQERQRDRIFRVGHYFLQGGTAVLDSHYRPVWNEAQSDADRLRVVVDQVASLTETRLERIDREAAALNAGWS